MASDEIRLGPGFAFGSDAVSTQTCGATPKNIKGTRPAATMADVDLAKVQKQMAATIERAKAEDPRELRRQIAELRRELAQKEQPQPCDHERQIARLELEVDFYATGRNAVIFETQQTIKEIREHLDNLFVFASRRSGNCPDPITKVSPLEWDRERAKAMAGVGNRPTTGVLVSPNQESADQAIDRIVQREPRWVAGTKAALPRPQQRILDTLARFESIGLEQVVKEALAALVGVSCRSSAYGNNLGALRTERLISYPQPGYVSLTESGRCLADRLNKPLTLGDLQSAWLAMVSRPQASILEHLIQCYPKDCDRSALAESVGVSPISSAFGNNLGRLRTLGAIDYPTSGRVRATNLVFPEGLK